MPRPRYSMICNTFGADAFMKPWKWMSLPGASSSSAGVGCVNLPAGHLTCSRLDLPVWEGSRARPVRTRVSFLSYPLPPAFWQVLTRHLPSSKWRVARARDATQIKITKDPPLALASGGSRARDPTQIRNIKTRHLLVLFSKRRVVHARPDTHQKQSIYNSSYRQVMD